MRFSLSHFPKTLESNDFLGSVRYKGLFIVEKFSNWVGTVPTLKDHERNCHACSQTTAEHHSHPHLLKPIHYIGKPDVIIAIHGNGSLVIDTSHEMSFFRIKHTVHIQNFKQKCSTAASDVQSHVQQVVFSF